MRREKVLQEKFGLGKKNLSVEEELIEMEMSMIRKDSTREGGFLQGQKKKLGQETSGGLENLLANVRAGIGNGDVNFFSQAAVGKLGLDTVQSLRVGKFVASHEALDLNVERNEDAPDLVEERLPTGVEQERDF